MAVTGYAYPQVVIPVALYRLVKTRSAVGLTEAEIVLPIGCELGSYNEEDLPEEFATWESFPKIQLIVSDLVTFKQWNAIWKR